MKSLRTTSEAPVLAMDNMDDVTGSHMVSKTPADDSVTPYPISRQNHRVSYQKDANGYWNFVQCDAFEIN